MKLYPIFLNLQGRKAVVFGAGRVALRKIKDLLKAGARVEVSSREFSGDIVKLSRKEPHLKLRSKINTAVFLKKADLVFITTSDSRYNEQIARACRGRKILVNAAGQPQDCDFFVPSHFEKGRLQVAISTGGASPLMAKKFREELTLQLRPEALRLLNQMGRLREQARLKFPSQKSRKSFFKQKIGNGFHFFKNTRDYFVPSLCDGTVNGFLLSAGASAPAFVSPSDFLAMTPSTKTASLSLRAKRSNPSKNGGSSK